jgi:hypothetical protein
MSTAEARERRAERLAERPPRPELRLVSEAEAAPRRTVRVTGRPGPDVRVVRLEVARSAPRGRHTPAARLARRPDRVALWAFVLGIFLVFMSVATAHADVLV